MIELIQSTNSVLGTLGLFGLVLLPIVFYDYAKTQILARLVERFGLQFLLGTTIGGFVLTLVYSEYFGVPPCGLCWFERVFLYPQIVLISIALYYKDKLLAPRYGIGLSLIGLIISLYHHYIQMGGSQFVRCPTTGVDCAKRFLFEYNFITFPLLSAILFAFLILTYLYILKSQKTQ